MKIAEKSVSSVGGLHFFVLGNPSLLGSVDLPSYLIESRFYGVGRLVAQDLKTGLLIRYVEYSLEKVSIKKGSTQ